jgi:MtN3 and saliva related transmembrane protein
MDVDLFTFLGFTAGAVTSVGFIPQLIKGYRTKKLNDVSYWMPTVITFGMSLWLLYGIIRNDITIIIANSFGVMCNVSLIIMKKQYMRETE